MYVGMEILGTITKVTEIGLTVALPNSLTGHVAITEISDPLTEQVQEVLANDDSDEEEVDEDDEEEDEENEKKDKGHKLPNIKELFVPGQVVRVQTLAVPTVEAKTKKIKLTLNPTKLNKSLRAADLEPGVVLEIFPVVFPFSLFSILTRFPC